jgi:hypothetical protein
VRFPSLLLIGIVLAGVFVHAQQDSGDAEKKRSFLRAREQMRTVPPATPPPASPAPVPPPSGTPKPKLAATEETPRPRPRPRGTPLLVITPKPAVTPPPGAPRSAVRRPDSQQPAVVIEKPSGFENAEVVPGEKESGGWWFSGPKYKYLTKAVRSEIEKAPVKRNRWRYIVVHNSATRQGSAKAFNYYHLRVRKMPNGLAYHFVIGNGSATGDGEIEIGSRWTRQINGGHVHSDYLNNIALGICLVGDYNRDIPTPRQLEALDELIRYLRKRVGKVDGKISIVKAHREINPPRWPTDCPGDKFPYRWFHGKFD